MCKIVELSAPYYEYEKYIIETLLLRFSEMREKNFKNYHANEI